MNRNSTEVVALGAGCFWCTEAIFKEVKGVKSVVSGYTGGNVPGRPTYREICSGLTGHVEAVLIRFDPVIISFSEILLIFMAMHNPTTTTEQNGGFGTQYKSVIYFSDAEQQRMAETILKEIGRYFNTKVATEVSPLCIFYNAEDYHQNYYGKNPKEAYCQSVINPKLTRLRTMFTDKFSI